MAASARGGPVVIGISAHFHDAACCLLDDGRLVAAAHEERFTRAKQDPRLPVEAVRYCLREAQLTLADVDCVAYYENPVKKLDRQLWNALPRLLDARPEALFRFDAARPLREVRELLGYQGAVEIVDHHLSHAASAYYYSGFPRAAVLTVDAVGEWATTAWGVGDGDDLELVDEVRFPHSLGLFYSTLTNYLGFEVNEGEYKVMGLAPYGEPCHAERLRQLICLHKDGKFTLDLSYFDFSNAEGMTTPRLVELLGRPPREPESKIEQFHCDVARSIQLVTEEVMLALARRAHELEPSENLCMAGGVALNVVATRRIVEEGPFARIFVQPAAGDAGGSLGAAAIAHRRITGRARQGRMRTALLGPRYAADDIARLLTASGEPFLHFRDDEDELVTAVADRLAEGKVVGWFHGRMEFGPRALGARSIIADPRGPQMRDRINAIVKKREAFRPFAPVVLADRAAEHFKINHESPFMLETCQVISPLHLPAITHVDGSARVQTVTPEQNPRFYRLIEAFAARTNCPILLNTSFNLAGEPIVCTPEDALLCFLRSEIDCVVLEDVVIDRESVPQQWRAWFEGTRHPGRSAVSNTVYTLL